MSDQPKRRGRPKLQSAERKSTSLKFRTRGDLRQRIEEAALANGRSASEEAEHRLLRSFQDDDIRRIIREEIATACLAERITTTFMPSHTINITGSVRRSATDGDAVPVQIFGRDHLPS